MVARIHGQRHRNITQLGDWWDIASQWLIAIIAILVASAFAAAVGFLLFLFLLGVAS